MGCLASGHGIASRRFPGGLRQDLRSHRRCQHQFRARDRSPDHAISRHHGHSPGDPGRKVPFPPHRGGGNMDNRHLTAGATLWLPVWVDGGMFSCGDPHAAQGDGEVCVTAIECPMKASLKFTLHKSKVTVPSFHVPPAAVSKKDEMGYYATMGIDSDLM